MRHWVIHLRSKQDNRGHRLELGHHIGEGHHLGVGHRLGRIYVQKHMIIMSLNDMIQDGIKYLIDMKDHLIDQEESTEVPKDHEGKKHLTPTFHLNSKNILLRQKFIFYFLLKFIKSLHI